MQKLTPYKRKIEILYMIGTFLMLLIIGFSVASCTTPQDFVYAKPGYQGAKREEIKEIIKQRNYEENTKTSTQSQSLRVLNRNR